MRVRTAACAAGLLLPLLAAAARHSTAPATARDATPQEIKSFSEFYRDSASAGTAAAPSFEVTRPRGQRRWDVLAWVDAAPRRGPAGVCRMSSDGYRYQPAAPRAQRWSAITPERQFVWLAGPSGCAMPAHPLRLEQPLSDDVIATLIGRQAALLQRARLLLAGNTSCARLRSLPFALRALGVAAAPTGAFATSSAMYRLTFDSDRASVAQVTVRRHGAEYTAWDVSCRAD